LLVVLPANFLLVGGTHFCFLQDIKQEKVHPPRLNAIQKLRQTMWKKLEQKDLEAIEVCVIAWDEPCFVPH